NSKLKLIATAKALMLECGEAPKSSLLAVTLLYVVCQSLPPLSVSLSDLQLSHVCTYVFGNFSLTIEILSNMETKLCLVLHVDHKLLNIQTTQLKRLRNVNAIVLFIQLHRSSTVHLRLFTVQPLPSQDGGELARRSNHRHHRHIYMSMAAMPFSMFVYPPILFFSGSAAVSSRRY